MLTAGEIADRLQGKVVGDANTSITGLKPASHAGPGDLTFAENEKYLAAACETEAAAILVQAGLESDTKTLIEVRNVRVALAVALEVFAPEHKYPEGIHESAVVAESAEVDPTASIGSHCVVEDGARIGPGATLISQNTWGVIHRSVVDVGYFPMSQSITVRSLENVSGFTPVRSSDPTAMATCSTKDGTKRFPRWAAW